jgi:hypothetical protein
VLHELGHRERVGTGNWEARFAEFRDTLCELVTYASAAGKAVLREQSA